MTGQRRTKRAARGRHVVLSALSPAIKAKYFDKLPCQRVHTVYELPQEGLSRYAGQVSEGRFAELKFEGTKYIVGWRRTYVVEGSLLGFNSVAKRVAPTHRTIDVKVMGILGNGNMKVIEVMV